LANAISYAENGFEVDSIYHLLSKFRLPVLQRNQSRRNVFLRNGEISELGSLIKQPDLARKLELIVDEGAEALYQSEAANRLVSSV
jgi:gamma-glutamyltranspeptidase/glutathione hydrolase